MTTINRDFIRSLSRSPEGEEICDERYAVRLLAERAPPLCECARAVKRPLSWGVWLPGISGWRDMPLDRWNKELSHEHLVFPASGDSIGFGPQGLFTETYAEARYVHLSECFDGSLMREAIAATPPPGRYSIFTNNCQHFVAAVRRTYRALVDRRAQ